MFKKPTIMQEMDMKDDFRKLLKTEGVETCYQVLYEILLSGNWLAEIILEERDKNDVQ